MRASICGAGILKLIVCIEVDLITIFTLAVKIFHKFAHLLLLLYDSQAYSWVCKSLWALNTSSSRNRGTFLWVVVTKLRTVPIGTVSILFCASPFTDRGRDWLSYDDIQGVEINFCTSDAGALRFDCLQIQGVEIRSWGIGLTFNGLRLTFREVVNDFWFAENDFWWLKMTFGLIQVRKLAIKYGEFQESHARILTQQHMFQWAFDRYFGPSFLSRNLCCHLRVGHT